MEEKKYKIYLVEDDEGIGKKVQQHLERWEYQVEAVKDFRNILGEIIQLQPHLIIMDITLPYYNGFYWCSEIRKLFKIPIVFISSASDNMNIVMAMGMGGDDFIIKPFDLTVLIAKIGAIIRRSYSYSGQINILEHKNVILNLLDATVTYHGEKVKLSKNEFIILSLLMENKGSIVSRDTIMMQLWDNENFIDDNTLTVNITRIRKKLKEVGMVDFIKTKKGIGYLIDN